MRVSERTVGHRPGPWERFEARTSSAKSGLGRNLARQRAKVQFDCNLLGDVRMTVSAGKALLFDIRVAKGTTKESMTAAFAQIDLPCCCID